jgi:hypothetical protein
MKIVDRFLLEGNVDINKTGRPTGLFYLVCIGGLLWQGLLEKEVEQVYVILCFGALIAKLI